MNPPMLPPLAYIGPGAGFAFLGSFLTLLVAFLLAFSSFLTFPFRALAGFLRRKRAGVKARVDRVLIVGLDGLDPSVAGRWMDDGLLPNLAQLRDRGTFTELESTCPPISPVAWSSFATGTNPGKHNIFDFLNRDLKSYLPELSSSRIRTDRKGRPEISLLRKSRPFWTVLGDCGVFATILRVPITFPPERFRGLLLSAMCVPDLRGTQGTFTFYESNPTADGATTGGERIRVDIENNRILTQLPGPTVGGKTLTAPARIDLAPGKATLRIDKQRIDLVPEQYSDWVRVSFRSGRRRVRGICRFLLRSIAPDFKLYVTPVNIDPESPAMPISHPRYYAPYLAKLHGSFATLGLAEDTWALDADAIDRKGFLKQVADIHSEREAMFLDAVRRTRRGICCCVFDITDRIQHEFLTAAHRPPPTDREAAVPPGEDRRPLRPETVGAPEQNPVLWAYRKADELVGKVMKQAGPATTIFVLSDHGFLPFQRGVNLNLWLQENGYLHLEPDASGQEYLKDVDWSRTRAYTFGLSGIYLNRAGRERQGIVETSQCERVKTELMAKLRELRDPATGTNPIKGLYDAAEVYDGPYSGNGPDIIVGYDYGYRASWDAAVGKTAGELFEENDRPWGADHCVDQSLVPGVLYCNNPIQWNGRRPAITDLAPTILDLWGIKPPAYMDGRPLEVKLQ